MNNTPASFDCSICMNNYSYSDITVAQLPCSHQFCYKCFLSLETTICPLCRHAFEFEIQPPHSLIKSWERNLVKWIKEEVETYMQEMQILQGFEEVNYIGTNMVGVETFILPPVQIGATRQGRRRRRRSRSGTHRVVNPADWDMQ